MSSEWATTLTTASLRLSKDQQTQLDSYQVTASTVDSHVWIWCSPFKSEVSLYFPQSCECSWKLSFWPLKPKCSEAHLPSAGPPKLWSPPGCSELVTPMGELLQCDYSPLVGYHWGKGLDYIASLHLLPISLWLLLHVFRCKRSFLVGFSIFLRWLFYR